MSERYLLYMMWGRVCGAVANVTQFGDDAANELFKLKTEFDKIIEQMKQGEITYGEDKARETKELLDKTLGIAQEIEATVPKAKILELYNKYEKEKKSEHIRENQQDND